MRADHKGWLGGEGSCGWIGGAGRRRGRLTTPAFCALLLTFAVASPAPAAPAYPLQKSANGRYLVDQNNVPYLITGDSPQALIVNLSEPDAETFLADRNSNGFNTVWINLLCNWYTGGRTNGSTFDGILPFTNTLPNDTNTYDLTTPNEVYFAHVDRVLNLAAQQGLLVLLDPIETGGWLPAILSNGTNNCRAYGQYLGNRYKNFDNILWISGNDYALENWSNPNVDAVVRQVALGIQDNDSRHIHTLELEFLTSGSLDDTNWAPIISLNASYTYYPTYAQVLNDYNRTNFLPVFMVEANYENEDNFFDFGTPLVLRQQEYWSLLSGACGQLYGNHYTWQFLSDWQTHLDTTGSTQMGYVKALFEPRRWYDLVPDQSHTLVTAGYGTFLSTGSLSGNDYATAARTPDGALAIVYMPTTRTVTVDMTQLNGPVIAQWYDPSRGVYTAIPGSPFANSGLQDFPPTGTNADGDGDWVLVLESAPNTTAPGLTITQPSDFQEFSNSLINVTGTASDANGISSVTVNGAAATLTGSNWSAEVSLSIGTNLLTVIATDASLGANGTTNTVHAIFQPPPSAFALVSPADGSSGLSPQPVLTWTPSSSDASFIVQVATTTDFASPVFSQNGLPTTSTTVTTGLTNGVTYFWRVTATNAGGSIIASNAPFQFTTVPVASTIICPSDVTVPCASQVPPADFAGGSVTNLSSGATVSWVGDLTNNMTCPNRFTIQRTYLVTGGMANPASCTQIITVNDTVAPTITGPANVTAVTDPGKCYASGVALGSAVAVGSCGGNATVANNTPSQFPKGANTVVWTATDSCHNSSTCTQLVIVVDNQPPTITGCAQSLTVSAGTNGQSAVPAFTNAVIATDNCTPAGLLGVTQNPTPGTMVGLGTNTVTITVKDDAGNASECTTSFIVTQPTANGTTAPTIACPADLTIGTDDGKCYASGVALGAAIAVGGCSGNPTVVNNAPSQFPKGTNMVVWTATDSCHNKSTCTQLVIVVDDQPPIITQCAPSLVALATTNGQTAVPAFINAVVTADNCTPASSLNITQDPTPGTLVGLGTNTVTITVKDSAGNVSQCAPLFIVTQSVARVDTWEVTVSGVPRATCVLQFAADSTVSGYGVEQSFCGAFTVTGTWSQDLKGRISGAFDQVFSDSNCQHSASINGTFAAKPSKNTKVSATARDSMGAFQWNAVHNPSAPVLVAGWGGTLKVKQSKTAENYQLTPEDSRPGLYDIRGQSADATYTLSGTLIVTSRNLVTAYIVRQFPTGPVTSFYTGKVNLLKQTLTLTGKDATGTKHQLSAAPE